MAESISKQNDIRARELMLEAVELCLRTGQHEAAKSILADSKKMAERINTHDYSREDEIEGIISGKLTKTP